PRAQASRESEQSISRSESRARLRATVSELLRDTVAIGVSHLSPAIHERLTTAATWAQGVEYHRLALLLRRLADQADLLLARSASSSSPGPTPGRIRYPDSSRAPGGGNQLPGLVSRRRPIPPDAGSPSRTRESAPTAASPRWSPPPPRWRHSAAMS